MRQFFGISILSAILAGLVSCEKEINFKGKITEPLLVVNSILAADSMVVVHLSQSRFVLGVQNDIPAVDNAVVDLFVNGEPKGSLMRISSGFYVGLYRPKPHDTVRIEAGAEGFEPVESETIIPKTPDFVLSDTSSVIIEEEYTNLISSLHVVDIVQYRQTKIRLKLADDAGKENFYYIKGVKNIYGITKINGEEQLTYLYSYPLKIELSDALKHNLDDGDVFSELFDEESTQTYNLFNDFIMNGKDIFFDFSFLDLTGLTFKTGDREEKKELEDVTVEYLFEVAEVSKDLYLYIVSGDKAQKNKDNFLVEPVQVHNNIKNGVGILGSYTPKKISVRFQTKYDGSYY